MKGFGVLTTILVVCALVTFAAFCIGMGIFAFLMTFFQYAEPELNAQNNFDPAVCLVTGHNGIVLVCNSQGSNRRCYQYATSVNVNVTSNKTNETWQASANKRNKYRFGSVENARAWLNEHPVGETYKCYYNPKDHQTVVFSRAASAQNVIVPLVLAGLFCLATTICGPLVVIFLFGFMSYGVYDIATDEDDPDNCCGKLFFESKR